MKRSFPWTAALAAAVFSLTTGAGRAELLISANDGKAVLVDGVNTVPANPLPDSVSIFDLSGKTPKITTTILMPTSLVGPPSSVAIARDESFALVTAATKINPADKTKIIPHNIVSVIDLTATPPKVIATLETGAGASGVAINRAGTLALICNRVEGTISVFTIKDKVLTPAGKVKLGGDGKSGPSAVAFTPDGKRALVTRDGDHRISILTIEHGSDVLPGERDLFAGLKPYGLSISPRGDLAAVTNVGMGGGDTDTISLIDLAASPPRVVDTVSVGASPESLTFSPDGKRIAVVVINGTNKPAASPFFHARGRLPVYEVKGGKLSKLAETPIGRWCQGAG